jgi:phosphatidylglycerol:prolipoprotein diacylglycerol transferase
MSETPSVLEALSTAPILAVLIDAKTAVVISVVIGWIATFYFGRRVARIPFAKLVAGTAVLTVSGLAGARLHYVIASSTAPDVMHRLTESGVHAGGGMVGLMVGLVVLKYVVGLSPAVQADVSAMGAGVALAVYRLGCFARGCCFGTPSDLPWAMRHERNSVAFLLHVQEHLVDGNARWSAPMHPLPLYFAAAAVVITVVGRLMYPHRRYDGQVALVSLVLFSSSTLALESLRATVPGQTWWGPFPQLVWIAAALSALSVVLVALQTRHGRKPAHH